jgi:UDP-N-acetylmuramyl tripeptide synthase
MGEIAARLSDRVVLTSDNPRTEDPAAIVKDVEEGVRKFMLKIVDGAGLSCQVRKSSSDRGYVIELDRRKAIELAIELAIAGDLILIAGKGHEDYQILGVNKIHFDDREVAREALMREAST